MEKGQTILIVDPETDFLEWAQHQLQTGTTRVLTATTADEGGRTDILAIRPTRATRFFAVKTPTCSSAKRISRPSAGWSFW